MISDCRQGGGHGGNDARGAFINELFFHTLIAFKSGEKFPIMFQLNCDGIFLMFLFARTAT